MGLWFPACLISIMFSLSVINYLNWWEFALQSSQEDMMQSMQRFLQYEQNFSRVFWLQIQQAGIHNEKHSHLVHNSCPSQSVTRQLRYTKPEERFSLCLSCVHSHVTFKALSVTAWYWTRRLVVPRSLKWMELIQLVYFFFKPFLTVTVMRH